MDGCEGQDYACRCEFGDRSKGVIVFNAMSFHEPLCYQMGLIACDGTMHVSLQAIGPPAPNNIGVRRCIDYIPSPFVEELTDLLLHSLVPVWPSRATVGLALIVWLCASQYGCQHGIVTGHLSDLRDFSNGCILHTAWEFAVITCGCPFSSADALDVLGWPLDPGSSPFGDSGVTRWHVRLAGWLVRTWCWVHPCQTQVWWGLGH